MTGGYFIIDLEKVAIATSGGTTFSGIYDKIEGNDGRPILLENVVIGTTEFNTAAWIAPYVSSGNFVFHAYNYTFTVTDEDLVTVAAD